MNGQPREFLVVVLAFGVPASIKPNRWLAKLGSNLARLLNGVVFTQRDIEPDEDVPVVRIKEVEGKKPPPTLRVCRAAVEYAVQNGFKKVCVVALLPHLWRARRDMRKAVEELGADLEVFYPLDEIAKFPEEECFTPESTQERTQTREAWNGREDRIKQMPWPVYKAIAS